MGFNFKATAQANTSLSVVMEGRERIKTEQICNLYPDGVTVDEFDIINTTDAQGKADVYAVCAFKEDPKACFFGGVVLTNICGAWAQGFGGDCAAASAALKAEGGVKMKFTRGKTKQGRDVTNVEIL